MITVKKDKMFYAEHKRATPNKGATLLGVVLFLIYKLICKSCVAHHFVYRG
jgi:hypothetical protein